MEPEGSGACLGNADAGAVSGNGIVVFSAQPLFSDSGLEVNPQMDMGGGKKREQPQRISVAVQSTCRDAWNG